MKKLVLVLISLVALSGCAVTGDTHEQFASKVLVGTVLNETGLGEIAGIQSSGSIRVKTGAVIRNARGEEIVLIPRGDSVIRVP